MLKKLAWIKGLLIFLAPSLIAGVGIGVYPGYKIYDWTWNDAGFCTTCHVHDYATIGWEKSAHGQVTTCHDCHHQPLRAYAKEMYLMAFHRPKFPKDLHHTPYVPRELCNACHVANPEDTSTITGPMKYVDIQKIPKVNESYQHRVHLEKETDLELLNHFELSTQERAEKPEPIRDLPIVRGEKRKVVCADCHGGPANRGHNFSAVDVSCVRCHQDAHKKQGKVSEFGCRTCHFRDFLVPGKEKREHTLVPDNK